MNQYLKLPTGTKWGWLMFIGGFVLSGLIAFALGEDSGGYFLFGAMQIMFVLAFIIEIISFFIKPKKI